MKLKLKLLLGLLGLVLVVYFLQTRREGFENATCPDGSINKMSCSDGSEPKCLNGDEPVVIWDAGPGFRCVPPTSIYDIRPGATPGGSIPPCDRPEDMLGRTTRGEVCIKASSTSTTAPPSSTSTGATSPASSSSSSTTQPTSSQFSQRIWGPPFVGTGQVGSGDGDSTKTTSYPQLLGGNASQYKGGDGSKIQFPSLGSLGLNADANFLPFSRSPGDMDLIADPFRVSKTFSAASYSPTPAPAPFLTDFSKFQ